MLGNDKVDDLVADVVMFEPVVRCLLFARAGFLGVLHGKPSLWHLAQGIWPVHLALIAAHVWHAVDVRPILWQAHCQYTFSGAHIQAL